jgi:hypothetical protein
MNERDLRVNFPTIVEEIDHLQGEFIRLINFTANVGRKKKHEHG